MKKKARNNAPVSPGTTSDQEQGLRFRRRTTTGPGSTSNSSLVTDVAPLDEYIDFDNSLYNFTMPDIASIVHPTISGPESQETAEANLQLCGYENPHLLLEPCLVKSTSSGLETPLHMAVRSGSSKIVQLLLQHGADHNARDAQGMTPLAHAIIGNHESVANTLLSRGAQVLAIDKQQRSALHLAVLHSRERLLTTLIRHCGRNSSVIDECDMEGQTPLHIAIKMSHDLAVEALCEAGADVQLQLGVNSTLATA